MALLGHRTFDIVIAAIENQFVELMNSERAAKNRMSKEDFLEELKQEKAKFEQKLAYDLKLAENKQKEHSTVTVNVNAKLTARIAMVVITLQFVIRQLILIQGK